MARALSSHSNTFVRLAGGKTPVVQPGLGLAITDLPPSWNDQPARAGIWEHPGFRGRSLGLPVGVTAYDPLAQAGLHDAVTGLQVREGYKLQAYRDVEGGRPQVLIYELVGPAIVPDVRDHPDIASHWDNSASAFRVVDVGSGNGGNGGKGGNGPNGGEGGGGTNGGPVKEAGLGDTLIIVGGLGLLGTAVYTIVSDQA